MAIGRKKNQRNNIMFRTYVLAVVIILVASYGVYRVINKSTDTEDAQAGIEQLAKCLTDSGAKLYGASWCPHCVSQKKAFGESVKYIDYIECAVNGSSQSTAKECVDANITNLPTWIFGDGTREVGKKSFEKLAELSGCDWGVSSPAEQNIEVPR